MIIDKQETIPSILYSGLFQNTAEYFQLWDKFLEENSHLISLVFLC